MTVENVAMGEQPIFSTKAHVFHIDPTTKKSWIPASSTAVSVSFFFDSTRNLYRIISVEGTKAVINSTITPNMTFTKTSQKFGQWSDVRANTVYGLGFASEADLNKFIEKFQEVKEATKSAQKYQANGTAVSTPVTSASASPVNVRSTHAHIRAPSPSPAPAPSPRLLEDPTTIPGPHLEDGYTAGAVPTPQNLQNDVMNANTLKSSLVAHQRSQSLSGLQQQQMDSPKHQGKALEKGPSSTQGPIQSPVPPNLAGASLEAQLKYENDRLKLALAQSSANAKKWEVELQTLKNNNARLTSALQESTANVEEWKRQLQAYKDENARMKIMILELEASKGNVDAAMELKKELHALRLKAENLEAEVREKEVETHRLAKLLQDSRSQHMMGHHNKYDDTLKNLQLENESLKNSLSSLQRQLDATVAAQDAGRRLAETLHGQLGEKLHEIMELHGEVANALST